MEALLISCKGLSGCAEGLLIGYKRQTECQAWLLIGYKRLKARKAWLLTDSERVAKCSATLSCLLLFVQLILKLRNERVDELAGLRQQFVNRLKRVIDEVVVITRAAL